MQGIKGWLVPTIMALGSTTAHARMDAAAVEIAAMGIAAYEMNKDRCAFEDIIHSKFKELDTYFRNEAPYSWDRMKRKATIEIPATLRSGMLGNDPTQSGHAAECANAGMLMNLGMVPAMFFVMTDPDFGAALKRLSNKGQTSTGATPQPPVSTSAILNFEAMQPLASAYEDCWVANQRSITRTDCMTAVDPKLRALNNGSSVSITTREYAMKFLENIMFANWYNQAIDLKLPWNERFPYAENLSNSCVEMESAGTANRYQVIDCINKPTRQNLVAAWKLLDETRMAWPTKADGYSD